MGRSVKERRQEPRTQTRDIRARVRTGHRLVVIDVSCKGALVEAGQPLRPGSQVEVHLENAVRFGRVPAEVLRCAVAAIDITGVTYRAALGFKETCEWVCEGSTHRESECEVATCRERS
jgi:hypothetical protein